MRKKPIYTLIKTAFVFLISFPLYSQTAVKYDIVSQINKNLPDYGFVVKESRNKIGERSYLLNVYSTDSNKLVQTIDLTMYDYFASDQSPRIDSLIDVNFDGYRDICIITGIGELGKNTIYAILFFNKDDGRFDIKKVIGDIYNIEVDDSSKQIYETIWTGCLNCITWKTYIINDDKLVLIKRDYQDLDRKNNILRRFVEFYKNGKLISKKELKPIDD